jgi:hypothetical protein
VKEPKATREETKVLLSFKGRGHRLPQSSKFRAFPFAYEFSAAIGHNVTGFISDHRDAVRSIFVAFSLSGCNVLITGRPTVIQAKD